MADLPGLLQLRLSGLGMCSPASLAPLQATVCPWQTALLGLAPGVRPCIAASTVSTDIISCRVSWLRRSDFGNKAFTMRGISAASSRRGTVSCGPQRPGFSSPCQGSGQLGRRSGCVHSWGCRQGQLLCVSPRLASSQVLHPRVSRLPIT